MDFMYSFSASDMLFRCASIWSMRGSGEYCGEGGLCALVDFIVASGVCGWAIGTSVVSAGVCFGGACSPVSLLGDGTDRCVGSAVSSRDC